MNPVFLADHVLMLLVTIISPFVLAFWFFKHHKKSWKLVGIGAGVFLLLTVVEFVVGLGLTIMDPAFPRLLVVGYLPIVLGVFAEEVVRLFSFRYLLKRYLTWENAFLFGIGWGGIEAIIFGVSTFFELFFIYQPVVHNYIWPIGISRVVVLFLHIALSILMLQVFTKKNVKFFLYALLLHLGNNLVPTFNLVIVSNLVIVMMFRWIVVLALSFFVIRRYRSQAL